MVNAKHVESLARATLAHGLIQLAIHFQNALDDVGLSITEALQQAMLLAEEAIALAPELPDGHTALGRLILCHDDEEAIADAIEVLQHALTLDQEHDPAETALASARWRQGDGAGALDAVDRVLKRGNALPQPLLLRALIQMEAGEVEQARRDLERAVLLAPGAGLFRLDAAAAAAAAGDEAAAAAHREAARELLGEVYDTLVAAAPDDPSFPF